MMRRRPVSDDTLARPRPWLVVPLVTLVVVTLIARLIGGLLPDDRIGWVDAVRGGLATIFATSATAHFGRARVALIRMVPLSLPNPPRIVTLTGPLEIAGVVGLAAVCLAALLVAIFPANAQASRRPGATSGTLATPLWFRAVVQAVLIAARGLIAVAG